jgi:hypothetical protein
MRGQAHRPRPAPRGVLHRHWRGADASVLIDWTDPATRNASTRTPGREAIGRAAALAALRALLTISAAEVERLQRGVATAAQRMFYRATPSAPRRGRAAAAAGAEGNEVLPDAFDLLLDELAELCLPAFDVAVQRLHQRHACTQPAEQRTPLRRYQCSGV